jgi:hypothetical protein
MDVAAEAVPDSADIRKAMAMYRIIIKRHPMAKKK